MLRQTFLYIALITVLFLVVSGSSCNRRTDSGAGQSAVTIALSDKFSGLDTLSTTSPDSAADRLRLLSI